MNALIVGAGKSGAFLAQKLRAKHGVTIIELKPDRAAYLRSTMPNVRVFRGDGCEPSILDKAGVGEVDMVAALTGDDEDNLVVSFLAKMTHRVPLVFARTNHPDNEWMFNGLWGVDVPVSASSMILGLVEKEMSPGALVTLMGIKSEDIVIDEITLKAGIVAVGRSIAELGLPRRTNVMAIVRDGNVISPNGDTVLAGGDDVLILSHRDEEEAVRRALGAEE